MIQRLKMTLLSFSALFMFAVPLVGAGVVQAAAVNIDDNLCKGAELNLQTPEAGAAEGQCRSDNDAGTRLQNLIRTIINVISIIVGAIAVIMIIIGGFRYVTSGGNDTAVSGAKNTILYAIIGLIIVALAQVVVRFVLRSVSV